MYSNLLSLIAYSALLVRPSLSIIATANTRWNLVAEVSGTAELQSFGGALSATVQANTIVVGAPGDDTKALDAGAVYLITRTNGNWTMNPNTAVFAINNKAKVFFGMSVAMTRTGDTLVVGAPNTFNSQLYVFNRNGFAGTLKGYEQYAQFLCMNHIGVWMTMNPSSANTIALCLFLIVCVHVDVFF